MARLFGHVITTDWRRKNFHPPIFDLHDRTRWTCKLQSLKVKKETALPGCRTITASTVSGCMNNRHELAFCTQVTAISLQYSWHGLGC